jgi:hypothetical protein
MVWELWCLLVDTMFLAGICTPSRHVEVTG